jgi:hypothetical protein
MCGHFNEVGEHMRTCIINEKIYIPQSYVVQEMLHLTYGGYLSKIQKTGFLDV